MTWSLYSLYIWVSGWVNNLLSSIRTEVAAWGRALAFLEQAFLAVRLRVYNIERQLTNITMPSFPSFQQIFNNVLIFLGVYVYPGESAFHAVVRTILNDLNIPCKYSIPVSVALDYWLTNRISIMVATLMPAIDTVLGWVAAGFGIYRLPGESWWDAFGRRVREITRPWVEALLPTFETIADETLRRFGIYRKPGESTLDAIWRTFWESHPGTWQLVNWWASYKADVMAFYDDPQAWLWGRLERMFERYW